MRDKVPLKNYDVFICTLRSNEESSSANGTVNESRIKINNHFFDSLTPRSSQDKFIVQYVCCCVWKNGAELLVLAYHM